VLNAANEVAVANFLAGAMGFTEIPRMIEAVLERCPAGAVATLADVLAADRDARHCAERWLAERAGKKPGNTGARSGLLSTVTTTGASS
jgi:1-deoxy-D-xylulose-5-phosphate reductoisomerase